MAGTVPARLTAREGRRFGLQVGGAFAVLAGIAHWRGHPMSPWILGGLAAILLIGGLVTPGALVPVYRAWMRMAHAISKVTTPIVLGIVYFLVLTPIGLVLRAAGHRPLSHNQGRTAWMVRATSASDLERQF